MADQPTPQTQQPGEGHNDVKRIRTRIDAAEKCRKPHEEVWTKLRKYRAGNYFRVNDPSGDWLNGESYIQALNLLHSWEETTQPKLMYRRPEIICEPARITDPMSGAEIWDSAQRLGHRVNALLREMRAEQTFRTNLSASGFSAGILQVGFEMQIGQGGPVESKGEDGQPVAVDMQLAHAQGEEYIDGAMPFIRWIPASRFAPDPSATRLDDAHWVAVEYYRTRQDIRQDPQISEAFRASVQETDQRIPDPYGSDQDPGQENRDPQLGMVKMYAFYDRHRKQIIHLGGKKSGTDVVAYVADWEHAIEGYPFHILGFSWIPGQFWPLPPLSAWFGAAHLMDQIASHTAELATRSKTVNLYDSKRMDPNQAAEVANAHDGDLVGVPDLTGVKSIDMGAGSDFQLDTMQQMKGWIDLVSGQSDTQRGVQPPGEKATAAEINQTMDAAGFRTEGMKRQHHNFLAAVCNDLAAVTIYYKSEMSDMILVVDPDRQTTADFSKPIIGEVLNYRLRVEPTSTEKLDRAKMLARSESLIGLLSDPNIQGQVQMAGKQINLVPLIEEQIRHLGYPDTSRILPDMQPPDPMGAGEQGGPPPDQIAMQENEAMAQGQPVEASPDDDHATHLAIHQQAMEQQPSHELAEHIATHEQLAQQMGGAPPQQPQQQPQPMGAY